MSKNVIKLTFDQKGLSMETRHPATLAELLQVLLQAIAAAVQHFLKEKAMTDEDERSVRKELFDMLNAGFSKVLESIDPESSNNPNLTEVAILLAENQLIAEAEKKGMTVEDYLPIAKAEQQKALQRLQEKEKEKRKRNDK